MTVDLGKAVEVVFVIVAYALTSDKIKKAVKEIRKKLQPHDATVRTQIQAAVDTLRIRLGAQMVNVWQVSNGTDSLAKYSYKYVNIIYESFNPLNGASVKNAFKNSPVEDYLPLLLAIQNSKKYFIGTDKTDIPILRAAYQAYGIKTGIDYKFDNSDVYMGFLSVSFSDSKNLTPAQITEIEATAIYVYSLMRKVRK